ncbi:hypothetical protein EVAR_81967_1 [Eumeta japonica]|uniref:Uncharacterized protein n=1 Tax=Eumeta variegata TaxID=151549 RepID=A0A4C1VXF3_EUMVA|nr:hypothetical protein EVAR_81967_1 [Eumeta japonica]
MANKRSESSKLVLGRGAKCAVFPTLVILSDIDILHAALEDAPEIFRFYDGTTKGVKLSCTVWVHELSNTKPLYTWASFGGTRAGSTSFLDFSPGPRGFKGPPDKSTAPARLAAAALKNANSVKGQDSLSLAADKQKDGRPQGWTDMARLKGYLLTTDPKKMEML